MSEHKQIPDSTTQVPATRTVRAESFTVADGGEVHGDRAGVPWRWITLLTLCAVAIAWFIWLNRSIEPSAATTPLATTTKTTPEISAEAEFEQQYELRRAARQASELAHQYKTQLEQRNASAWDDARWQSGIAAFQAGDDAFQARNYSEAALQFARAEQDLGGMLKEADLAYTSAIAAAQQALANGGAMAALNEALRALELRPSSMDALALRHRAEQMPAVLDLLVQARSAQARGQVEQAMELTRKALEIDSDYGDGQRLLTELQSEIAQSGFLNTMTRGELALKAQRFDEAREAFTAAAQLEPQRPEPTEALLRVDKSKADATLRDNRARAVTLEQNEQWREAAHLYSTALKQDSGLAFAQEGFARAQSMGDLYAAIDRIVSNPQVLSDDQEFVRAQDLLSQADAKATDLTPGLKAKLISLGAVINAATQPVRLVLQSDNLTEVSIARIGRLGRFQTREVEVRPGAYAIVGVRDGYRDVRTEIIVRADLPPVDIRCSQPIEEG